MHSLEFSAKVIEVMFDLSAMMIGVDGFVVFLFASDHDVEDGGEFLACCYHGLQMTSFCTHVTEVVAERTCTTARWGAGLHPEHFDWAQHRPVEGA